MDVPEISRETIIDLVADMNRVGFGVLSHYLEPADLEDPRKFIESAVASAGGQYVALTGKEAVVGTLFEKLSRSAAFVNLLHQVYEQGSGRPAPDQSLYQVLRCLRGESGLKHALRFHYDSYVVTFHQWAALGTSSWHRTGGQSDRHICSISSTRSFWITRPLSICSALALGGGS
jgi:hypothetical protein